MPSKSVLIAQAFSKTGILSTVVDSAPSIDTGQVEVTTVTDLPNTGNIPGDQAFVQETNRLYLWNGSGWYNIALINTTPTWDSGGQPNASYILDTDSPQESITVTLAASDPEGLPINYTYVTGGSMDSMATISQDSSIFTIVPKTSSEVVEGVEYTGSITFRASDEINILPYTSSFTLEFITIIENSNTTSTLIKALGTGSNSTIIDSSSNNRTVTNGATNLVLSSWNPNHPKGQSFYSDGNDYVQTRLASTDFSFDGDFCIEGWVYHLTAPDASTYYFSTSQENQTGVAIRTAPFSSFNYAVSFDYGINASDTVANDNRGSTTLSIRQWHHIALTRDSGTMRLFVDGVLERTRTNSTNFSQSGGNKFNIGADRSSTREGTFKGWVNGVRVVKGYPVYTSAFTPPTTPPENIVGTVYLKNNYSYNGVDYAGTTKEMFPPNNSYRTNLGRSWSPFNTLMYNNSTHFGSIGINGSGSNYGTVNMSDVTIGTGDFTFQCWLYYNNQPNTMTIFDGRTATSSGLYIGMSPGGQATVNGSTGLIEATAQPPNGFDKLRHTWIHFAVVRNSGTLKIYKNGVEVYSTSNSSNISTLNSSTRIGQTYNNTSNKWPGYLYDVKLSSVAEYTAGFTPSLTPVSSSNAYLHLKGTEVQIADTASGLQIEQWGSTAAATTAQTKFNTYSMNFTRANSDHITIGNPYVSRESSLNFGTGDFTIEMWIYFLDSTSTHGILTGWSSGTKIWRLAAGNRMDIFDGGAWRYGSVGSIPLNQWNHIAFYRNSGTSYLAANGSSQVSWSDTTNYTAPTANCYIGRYSASYMNGYIEDFRITNGASRYTGSTYTVPTEAFKG
tara:strand:+ start:1064 stop:3589 length:2526 start_codon:yes stop_codon:yes gene_type:complete